MYLRRSAVTLSRSKVITPAAQRNFTWSSIFGRGTKSKDTTQSKDATPPAEQPPRRFIPFEEIKTPEDLIPPGALPGTVPTDFEQSTGLERLEILGKMQGIDVFDMRPLDASRMGTLDNPILVRTVGEEQLGGCTGYPADSHIVKWLLMTRDRPVGRCPLCGNVLKMDYVGPPHDPNAHNDDWKEPKTFADYVREEYKN